MIAIVDFGMGNLGSIANMLDRLDRRSVTTDDLSVLGEADAIIIPGVGAFDRGMEQLAARGLTDGLTAIVRDRQVPVLGICLGMQLLARRSEEGVLPGLGWIDADVIRFRAPGIRVPHMGWNVVRRGSSPSPLFEDDGERFYFVHSYHLACDDEGDVAAWAVHGDPFPAAVVHGNVLGVQFHPEKSHRFGFGLLGRFASLGSRC